MAKVILYEHDDFGGWSYEIDDRVGDLPSPYSGQASSLKVLVSGWVTFHSMAYNRGSHLCVKGPRELRRLRDWVKRNDIPLVANGQWNDEIVSVDPIAVAAKPYDGDSKSTHIE